MHLTWSCDSPSKSSRGINPAPSASSMLFDISFFVAGKPAGSHDRNNAAQSQRLRTVKLVARLRDWSVLHPLSSMRPHPSRPSIQQRQSSSGSSNGFEPRSPGGRRSIEATGQPKRLACREKTAPADTGAQLTGKFIVTPACAPLLRRSNKDAEI